MKVTNDKILRPKINNIESTETEKLFQIIKNNPAATIPIQCLLELLRRQEEQMQELKQELSLTKQKITKLESKLNPPKKKSGRKQKQYFLNGILIDDDELIRLIDGEYITISKLEKDVGAKKNVLCRRYERVKQKQK